MNEQAIQHLLQAKRHAALAAEAPVPPHLRERRRAIRNRGRELLRLILLDEPTPDPDKPTQPTRVTID